MAQLKLTAYQGIDPEDGDGTYMVTIHNPETPDIIDCYAMGVDANSQECMADIEGVKMALATGIWRPGKAQPIALQFLAMPETKVLWEVDVEGGRKQ